jgi:phenylalanyl-tRNA synthetase alpha chain
MLSRIEAEVLAKAEIGKVYSIEEFSKITGLNRDAVMKAVYLLKEKGFADVFETTKKSLKLTAEGKKYLLQGFPEEKTL